MATKVGEIYSELKLKDEAWVRGMENAHRSWDMLNQKLTAGSGGKMALPAFDESATGSIGRLQERILRLNAAIALQQRELEVLNRELQHTSRQFGDTSTQAERKRIAIQRVNSMLESNIRNLNRLQSELGQVNTSARSFSSVMTGMAMGAGFAAFQALQNVVARIGEGMRDAVADGIKFSASLEGTTARLDALTKDPRITANIISGAREQAEALRMPFLDILELNAGLVPVARLYGVELENLVQTAQMLAMIDPDQGMQGSLIALRELLAGSGDLRSINSLTMRFELPRQRLQQLVQEMGALEGLNAMLEEMGFGAEFLGSRFDTAQGRATALRNEFDKYRTVGLEDSFDLVNDQLERFLSLIDENEKEITAFAESTGNVAATTLEFLIDVGEVFDWEAFGERITNLIGLLDLLADAYKGFKSVTGGVGLDIIGGGLITDPGGHVIDTWDRMTEIIIEARDGSFEWNDALAVMLDLVPGLRSGYELLLGPIEEQERRWIRIPEPIQEAIDKVRELAHEIRGVPLPETLKFLPAKDATLGPSGAGAAESQIEAIERLAEYGERLNDLGEKSEDLTNRHTENMVELADSIAEANQSAADRVTQIQGDLYADLNELAIEHGERVNQIQTDLVQAQELYADDIADIHERMNERLADLAEDSADARMEYERRVAEATEDQAEAAEQRTDRLAERLEALDRAFRRRERDMLRQQENILNDLPANIRARPDAERYLTWEARDRLNEMRQRLQDERADHAEDRQRLLDDADEEVRIEREKQNDIVAELTRRFQKEEEERNERAQDIQEQAAKEEQDRTLRYNRAVTDLNARLDKERSAYARREEELRQQAARELHDVTTKNAAIVLDLQDRMRKEQLAYQTAHDKIQDEIEETGEKLDVATGFVKPYDDALRRLWEALDGTYARNERMNREIERTGVLLGGVVPGLTNPYTGGYYSGQPQTQRQNQQLPTTIPPTAMVPNTGTQNRTTTVTVAPVVDLRGAQIASPQDADYLIARAKKEISDDMARSISSEFSRGSVYPSALNVRSG